MREIKFRGKRKDNGQWITGYFLKDEITGQCFIFALGNSVNESEKVGEDGCLRFFAFEVEENTICQYTGLKDKNGKEIYEHNIVKTHMTDRRINSEEKDYIFEVVWCSSEASFEYRTKADILGNPCCVASNQYRVEVIGNIYENPDLLGGVVGEKL